MQRATLRRRAGTHDYVATMDPVISSAPRCNRSARRSWFL